MLQLFKLLYSRPEIKVGVGSARLCNYTAVLMGSSTIVYPCCCGFFVHVHVYTCALWVLPCLLCVLCISMYVL